MRGEKNTLLYIPAYQMGSPPLARGKEKAKQQKRIIQRITPACAGKSRYNFYCSFAYGDHPRLRGEKHLCPQRNANSLGSPPLARGKVRKLENQSETARITPACAGKRHKYNLRKRSGKDHPRLRGEKTCALKKAVEEEGSPPLARGKVFCFKSLISPARITPACAGKRKWDI